MDRQIEATIKHLEMIQSVINRLASNSFLLKGWSVTLAAAIVALASQDANRWFILLALVPSLAFWGLDAYFLLKERIFRCLYEDVRKALETTNKSSIAPFSMDVSGYPAGVQKWLAAAFAPSVWLVHGVVVGAIVVLAIVLAWLGN